LPLRSTTSTVTMAGPIRRAMNHAPAAGFPAGSRAWIVNSARAPAVAVCRPYRTRERIRVKPLHAESWMPRGALCLRPEALKFGFGFEAALIAPAQEADAARA